MYNHRFHFKPRGFPGSAARWNSSPPFRWPWSITSRRTGDATDDPRDGKTMGKTWEKPWKMLFEWEKPVKIMGKSTKYMEVSWWDHSNSTRTISRHVWLPEGRNSCFGAEIKWNCKFFLVVAKQGKGGCPKNDFGWLMKHDCPPKVVWFKKTSGPVGSSHLNI